MNKRFNFKLLGLLLAALLILTTVAYAATGGSLRLRGASQYLKMGGSTSGLLTIVPGATGTWTLTPARRRRRCWPSAVYRRLRYCDWVAAGTADTGLTATLSFMTRRAVCWLENLTSFSDSDQPANTGKLGRHGSGNLDLLGLTSGTNSSTVDDAAEPAQHGNADIGRQH